MPRTACSTCLRVYSSGTTLSTNSQGIFGPNLTHFMSRQTLGAGVAPNDDANLKSWLHDPQVLKPGCLMPDMKLDQTQFDEILAYLKTLN